MAGGELRPRESHSNKSFQPTKPFVTALAVARPAPNAFAAEADVEWTKKILLAISIGAHIRHLE